MKKPTKRISIHIVISSFIALFSIFILSSIFFLSKIKTLEIRLKDTKYELRETLSIYKALYNSVYYYGYEGNDNEGGYNSTNQTYTFTNGTYTVGEDIESGTYDIEAVSGYGKITGNFESGYLSMGIGIDESKTDHRSYNNAELEIGDTFTITSGVTLDFILQ